MPIRCLIIDDEPLAIQIIACHIAQLDELELVGSFLNPLEAFEKIKTLSIDLLFTDIKMPLLTGIDLVKSLQNPPGVIFTTAYRDYAIESYELNVIDYLVKPITFNRFFQAVNKFKGKSDQTHGTDGSHKKAVDHLFVNSNKKYIKVAFDQILYVESIKDYIRIHTADKNIITKDKISEFQHKLPQNFLRVHRSYIVNTYSITAFTSLDIEIGMKEIPIGSSYKKDVLAKLKQ